MTSRDAARLIDISAVRTQHTLKDIQDVQHQILHHFVIREVKEFFDDQCSNDNVYRSIWSGCIFRV